MKLSVDEVRLLRKIVKWRKANGWSFRRTSESPGRDHNGAPWGEDNLCLRWSKPVGDDGAEAEFIVWLRPDHEVMTVYFQPDDWDDTFLSWGPGLIAKRGIELVVNGLVDAGVLPRKYNSMFSSAFAAGKASVYDRIEYQVVVREGMSPRPIPSAIEAFRELGWWRRRYGDPGAYLERRFSKEPSAWERVVEEVSDADS